MTNATSARGALVAALQNLRISAVAGLSRAENKEKSSLCLRGRRPCSFGAGAAEICTACLAPGLEPSPSPSPNARRERERQLTPGGGTRDRLSDASDAHAGRVTFSTCSRRARAVLAVLAVLDLGVEARRRDGLPPRRAQRPLRPRARRRGEAGSADRRRREHWTVGATPIKTVGATPIKTVGATPIKTVGATPIKLEFGPDERDSRRQIAKHELRVQTAARGTPGGRASDHDSQPHAFDERAVELEVRAELSSSS